MASSVQRSKPTPYPSKARNALIRRAVVVTLVLLALVLVTISFRSPTSGALHDLQGVGSSVLRPFQVAGARIAKPFRDGYDYLDGLTAAKAQNEKLKQELAQLRAEVIQNAASAKKEQQLAALLRYEQGSHFPHGYRAVNAAVISFPDGPFSHTLQIAAGSSSGLQINTPVVSGDGLVGRVTNVFPDAATVTVLTAPEEAVAARDLTTDVRGVLHRGPGGTLILDQVSKQKVVHAGDVIVTDGTSNPRYPSLYPYGIPIGRVPRGGVGVTDTATFLQIQVQPFANLSSLDSVAALVKTSRGR
jgi:rod shape-determining protein MreC